MEKLDAVLNKGHGLCMSGPDNRLLLWNDRYVTMYRIAPGRLFVGALLRYGVGDITASPPRSRPQAPISASFDMAFARFFLFFPFRKETSISAPLTRTSSHRR